MPLPSKKVAFHTLGCKLNFSESSTIGREFEENGYQRVPSTSPADVYIINTCSVTENADKKCRYAIRKLIAQSPNAKIVVTGCYAQLKPEEVAAIPGVNLVVGASEKGNLFRLLDNIQADSEPEIISCDIASVEKIFPAYSSSDRTRSFLKIQDGCDYHCSYCTIPLARGKSRNLTIPAIVAEASEIAQKGIKEIILTGVNIGDFGKTTGETFLELITALDASEGVDRYRISSIEPNLLTSEIIDFVAHSKRFLPHFHIPLQSGSNKILALMRRRYKRELFAEKIRRIKTVMPNAFIGIDVIVGFPGETEEEFMQSYTLLEDLNVSFLHIFPYSVRPNTPAETMEPKVTQKEITDRTHRLKQLSDKLHRNFYLQNIGTTEMVLFEGRKKGDFMHGYTGNYIQIEIPYSKELTNKTVPVKITGISKNETATIEFI
ncbi:tRNA (N(6)-L-threonylcarbamoyladenosine(37)-C(2))-methylthiotransferase MtaB [Williamwhitmania taraxaci]|uniref:Threonylcarbamoyladenosine tRNA methylthiotransferase MtaB n=1 Tax=Williamwhitmania taraxaci TaxID=1640674 RepID=A0A1G6GRL0_9BACT|nr:tRNA (N(6)-L-threonylcarbamoyladenosine(37)-C(2))-methylthiotransferase MtaB [Williamwhitmania taraxaci]SDB84483.1 threonylcarbamoyladenosine tRNA methylthiotransferase MtaB [Williamwhitmania taraxaci]